MNATYIQLNYSRGAKKWPHAAWTCPRMLLEGWYAAWAEEARRRTPPGLHLISPASSLSSDRSLHSTLHVLCLVGTHKCLLYSSYIACCFQTSDSRTRVRKFTSYNPACDDGEQGHAGTDAQVRQNIEEKVLSRLSLRRRWCCWRRKLS